MDMFGDDFGDFFCPTYSEDPLQHLLDIQDDNFNPVMSHREGKKAHATDIVAQPPLPEPSDRSYTQSLASLQEESNRLKRQYAPPPPAPDHQPVSMLDMKRPRMYAGGGVGGMPTYPGSLSNPLVPQRAGSNANAFNGIEMNSLTQPQISQLVAQQMQLMGMPNANLMGGGLGGAGLGAPGLGGAYGLGGGSNIGGSHGPLSNPLMPLAPNSMAGRTMTPQNLLGRTMMASMVTPKNGDSRKSKAIASASDMREPLHKTPKGIKETNLALGVKDEKMDDPYDDKDMDDGILGDGTDEDKKRQLARAKNRIHAKESRARKKIWLDDLKVSVDKMKEVLESKEKQIQDMKMELEKFRKEKQDFVEDRAALQKLFQTASKAAIGNLKKDTEEANGEDEAKAQNDESCLDKESPNKPEHMSRHEIEDIRQHIYTARTFVNVMLTAPAVDDVLNLCSHAATFHWPVVSRYSNGTVANYVSFPRTLKSMFMPDLAFSQPAVTFSEDHVTLTLLMHGTHTCNLAGANLDQKDMQPSNPPKRFESTVVFTFSFNNRGRISKISKVFDVTDMYQQLGWCSLGSSLNGGCPVHYILVPSPAVETWSSFVVFISLTFFSFHFH
jgi:hypothetical protein